MRKHFTRRSNDAVFHVCATAQTFHRRARLARLVLTPRPWAYIIQNKRKAANTFRFASEINRHQLVAGFFGRILVPRPWAVCWLGSMP